MTNEKQIPIIHRFLPIQSVSELNRKEHWTVSSKRHKMQQKTMTLLMPTGGYPNPCLVVLTRCGGRLLDTHDNLPASQKWCVDRLSQIIVDSWDGKKPPIMPIGATKQPKRLSGREDDDPRIEWRYEQNTKKPTGVLIEIFPRDILDSKTQKEETTANKTEG